MAAAVKVDGRPTRQCSRIAPCTPMVVVTMIRLLQKQQRKIQKYKVVGCRAVFQYTNIKHHTQSLTFSSLIRKACPSFACASLMGIIVLELVSPIFLPSEAKPPQPTERRTERPKKAALLCLLVLPHKRAFTCQAFKADQRSLAFALSPAAFISIDLAGKLAATLVLVPCAPPSRASYRRRRTPCTKTLTKPPLVKNVVGVLYQNPM